MEEVAAYLTALLERAPLKTSRAYEAHRMVLGSLATELRGFAAAAGEPTGLQADLRAASSQAEERRVAERIDAAAVAYDRHVDDILLEHAARRAQMDPYVTGTVIADMDLAERGSARSRRRTPPPLTSPPRPTMSPAGCETDVRPGRARLRAAGA